MNDFDSIIMEKMDLTDRKTLQSVVHLNEADQNQILVSLTSKLYDKIVNKITDIDFGNIPDTKGDISKLENYDDLVETVTLMKNIVGEFNQDSTPIDQVNEAINNIKSRADLFEKSYAFNVELPIVLYNTIVLSIISSISFLINATIEYIKNPSSETYQISLDKIAYSKSKDHLLFRNLKEFNNACKRGMVDKTIENCISQYKSNLTGLSTGIAIILAGTALIALAKSIIPMLQELVYYLYSSRQKVSDYFAVQSELLQMNANNVLYNRSDIDDNIRNDIYKRQMNIATKFKNISNKFDISNKMAVRDSQKQIKDDNSKKYKIDDISDTNSNDSLF